ncbi:glutamate--tRNA ligase [Patescibacteria group bacterium]
MQKNEGRCKTDNVSIYKIDKMADVSQKIKVRFAPSPTGFLHVGGLRTALYNYLFAKKNNGIFVFRIEDTDRNRFIKGATEQIIQTMHWAGIDYDEGPEKGGKNAPYLQSERSEIYKKFAEELVKADKAYYCFCDPVRLTTIRQEQIREKKPPKYDRHCLSLKKEEVEELKKKKPYVIRLKVPDNQKIKFTDLIRGDVEINSDDLDDQILQKSDGYPTYHLANTVDDHLMGITHVIRGEEWIPSTPKHILLYKAFKWDIPEFAHLPLLLNKDKSKLSKRDLCVSVEDYMEQGYLPEAMLNFVALLGWNTKDENEIYSLDELIKQFDLERVHKGGAVFDLEKLNWINGKYIRQMKLEDLTHECKPYLENYLKKIENKIDKSLVNDQYFKEVVNLFQDRLEKIADITELVDYFFLKEINYDKKLLIFKKSDLEKTKLGLEKTLERLGKVDLQNWETENLNVILEAVVKGNDLKPGDVFWPIRAALSGREASPSPPELLEVFGKERSLERIKEAIDKLK